MDNEWTIQEMQECEQLQDGLQVIVKIDKETQFKGKIVGNAINGLLPFYIVECTDNFLPNETYPYKVASVPLSNIQL